MKLSALGVVVRIAAAHHRSDETMLGESLPVAARRILRSAIALMHAAGRGFRSSMAECGAASVNLTSIERPMAPR